MTELSRTIHEKIQQGAIAQFALVGITALFSPLAQDNIFQFGFFSGIILACCVLRLWLDRIPLFNHFGRLLQYSSYALILISATCWGILASLDIQVHSMTGADNLIIPMIAAGNAAAASTSFFYNLLLNRLYVLCLFLPYFCLFLFSSHYDRHGATGFTLVLIVYIAYIWREGASAHRLYWRNVELRDQALLRQKEVETSRAVAMGSAKMAAVGEMAGGIAHELNNPLTIIRGTAGILLDHSHRKNMSDEILLPSLERIQKTVDRMTKIIRSLLHFAQQTQQDEAVRRSLPLLIEEVLDLSQDRMKRLGVEVRLQIDEAREAWVQDRGKQISQALLNLLNNAADAISNLPDPWISIKANIADSHVHILVEDCGEGIPERNRAMIFQPFFTTKSHGDGTGLGLSISRTLIENLGGELSYDERSVNTRFVLKIPQCEI
jgi:signal transduction histidine kinase